MIPRLPAWIRLRPPGSWAGSARGPLFNPATVLGWKTEAAVAKNLAISQQTVSERKFGILRLLQPEEKFFS